MRTMHCFAGLMACFSILVTPHAQTADLLETRSAGQIAGLANALSLPDGVIPLDFGVAKYRVTYTMDYLGEPFEVSGALFVPVDDAGEAIACAMPTHTYMHGTIFRRIDAPSYNGFEGQLGFIMATAGAVCLMPDYLGLGSSDDVLHPYCHAASEAESGLAMLAALVALQDELGVGLNGQHFVSGYSQGGHASMAMAKRMQEDSDAGFPLAAAAPMSGPYDMSGTQLPVGMAAEQYSNPAYLAYILLSWQQTYGDIFVELSEIFQEPFASGLPAMFDGDTSGEMINAYLEGPTASIVQPGALEGLMAEDHPFFLAAQDNDLYQWVPESPIQMYYCTQDEQVFYENALVAESWMNTNGAQSVATIDGGPLDHGGCALLAILGGTLWINDQAALCTPFSVEARSNQPLTWRSSPEGTEIQGLQHGETWTLYGVDGKTIEQGMSTGQRTLISPPQGLSILLGSSGRRIRLAVD
ncbi:MAG: hypothetical protein L7S63_00970 [Flavobacteriales bacterium]|nr:hypothetical protein [Flavobacteriales bacterium]